jgi:predicted membrane protein
MLDLIKIIGIYDIICGIFILYSPHFFMINRKVDELHLRLFTYWIITYGLIRLIASKKIAYFTLLIEALCFFNELFYNDFYLYKLLFCIIACIYIYYFSMVHVKVSNLPFFELVKQHLSIDNDFINIFFTKFKNINKQDYEMKPKINIELLYEKIISFETKILTIEKKLDSITLIS